MEIIFQKKKKDLFSEKYFMVFGWRVENIISIKSIYILKIDINKKEASILMKFCVFIITFRCWLRQ